MDMIAEARGRLWKGSVEEKMTYLAIMLAFNFTWRTSMYLSRNSVVESQTVMTWFPRPHWRGGINRDDLFLLRWGMGRNKLLKLTRRMVNEELSGSKAGGSVRFAFSSQSLRIVGATTMVARGIDSQCAEGGRMGRGTQLQRDIRTLSTSTGTDHHD